MRCEFWSIWMVLWEGDSMPVPLVVGGTIMTGAVAYTHRALTRQGSTGASSKLDANGSLHVISIASLREQVFHPNCKVFDWRQTQLDACLLSAFFQYEIGDCMERCRPYADCLPELAIVLFLFSVLFTMTASAHYHMFDFIIVHIG